MTIFIEISSDSQRSSVTADAVLMAPMQLKQPRFHQVKILNTTQSQIAWSTNTTYSISPIFIDAAVKDFSPMLSLFAQSNSRIDVNSSR